ncbi:MAG TPA: dihydroneopterin aldolase [Candidatus Binatus sp.]|nr:dihydroneopterin aldolase [Candidatus Dormibacteraeota bacterium]HYL39867.1 dihydroneopterin aldolase [Candidatus Binatus sp.]
MSDRIVLSGMAFQARHGVLDWEKVTPQRFEVDLELVLDVRPAAVDDDLARTVDYRAVYRAVRGVVEQRTFSLIEALAEAIAHEILAEQATVEEVVVRVRKPEVRLDGPLDFAGVEIRRTRER